VQYLVDIEKLIKIKVEQVIIAGFEPEYDYTYPPGDKHRHRRSPVALAPAPASPAAARSERSAERSLPARKGVSKQGTSRRPSHIAADGFDFSKPYESAEPRPIAAAVDGDATKSMGRTEHPHKRRRAVAALLGGLGRE
jgi:ATP-dependent RNA helicase RhlE